MCDPSLTWYESVNKVLVLATTLELIELLLLFATCHSKIDGGKLDSHNLRTLLQNTREYDAMSRLRHGLSSGWQFRGYGDNSPEETGWLPVQKVPAQVHMDLLANGK